MATNDEEEELLNNRESSKAAHSGSCVHGVPKRYILLVLVFFGFVTMFGLRANLNVAIGAMVNNHTVIENGKSVEKMAEFDWNTKVQGVVLGSLYYGYPIFQVPGAWIGLKLGATRLFGFGIFFASLLTLLTPPATRWSVYALIALRAAEGLVLGVIVPCSIAIWGKWSHSMERTTLISFAASGRSAGTIITMPLAGLLTKYGFDGGWPSVFYFFGGFGMLWSLAWAMIVEEDPSKHSTISKKERAYLEEDRVPHENITVPWKAILTSKPVWAVVMANVSIDWLLYTILICLPTFIVDTLHLDIQSVGFLAAVPFILRLITVPISGMVSDMFRRKGVPTKTVRRVTFSTGIILSSITLVLTGYLTTSSTVIMCMSISLGFSGVARPAYDASALDIAPYFAGIIIGISNTVGTLSGFISPMIVGFITQNKTRSEWQNVFWITAGVNLFGAFMFCIFLDDKYQPWAQMGHALDKQEVDTTSQDQLDVTNKQITDKLSHKDASNVNEDVPTSHKNVPSAHEDAPTNNANNEDALSAHKDVPSICEDAPTSHKDPPSVHEGGDKKHETTNT